MRIRNCFFILSAIIAAPALAAPVTPGAPPKDTSVGDVATSPLSDVNIQHKEIPPLLLSVLENKSVSAVHVIRRRGLTLVCFEHGNLRFLNVPAGLNRLRRDRWMADGEVFDGRDALVIRGGAEVHDCRGSRVRGDGWVRHRSNRRWRGSWAAVAA